MSTLFERMSASARKADKRPPTIRIQLSRRKGFRLQEASQAANGRHAAKVDRTTIFGNPFVLVSLRGRTPEQNREQAAAEFVELMERGAIPNRFRRQGAAVRGLLARRQTILESLHLLKGANIACHCPEDGPCHGDWYLRNVPT